MVSLDQQFYTAQELANLLKISTKTIDRMVERGDLRCYRVGRVRRFWCSDIEKYLKAHSSKSKI